MSKAMAALDRMADTIGGCTCSMCAKNREDAATLRDYITTTESRIKELEDALAMAGRPLGSVRGDEHLGALLIDEAPADRRKVEP